jgi:hypothetical protein
MRAEDRVRAGLAAAGDDDFARVHGDDELTRNSDGRAASEPLEVMVAMKWFGAACAVAVVACGAKIVDVDAGPTPIPIGVVKQQAIDKIDLLFAVDNSASMGDKQDLLALAIPVLVGRLLNPNCVSTDTTLTCAAASDCSSLGAGADCDTTARGGKGQCFVPGDAKGGELQCTTIPGTKAEFRAVHDLHIGIVSSSLGGGGSSDVCVVSGNDSMHVDDKAHLLNRTTNGTIDGPPINNAKPTDGNGGNFLAWLPASDPRNAGKTPPNVTPYSDGQEAQLETDFKALVEGVQQHGCGLEAQLESWYRFLVQPDPWGSIDLDSQNPPKASLSGVDATLLKMRHDFLRPDSLVAIIQLTDEEDSWSDPLWLGGYGWTARTEAFPGGPGQGAGPRGTSECDEPEDLNNPTSWGPNNPDCTSCAFPASNKPVAGTPIGQDPNCNACAPGTTTCPQQGWYTPSSQSVPYGAADGLNVRYGNQYMRTRYGFDNQHDVQRYIDGLTKATAPDRDHEAHAPNPYSTTQRNCTNPLFAQDLPDGSDTSPSALCQLKLGSRTPDLVFYTLIGGVPRSLLEDGSGMLKSNLSADDWTKIVGKDPAHYVFDGIDPHMIESVAPRAGLAAPGTTYSLGSDPENGREWDTRSSLAAIDLQYACTFDLPTPKDCTAAANQGACDCTGSAATSPGGPPLCSTSTRTTQIKGKAYPTIRELRVAQGLGAQSVVASLCVKDVTSAPTSPSFGYNPAMQGIVNRLRTTLAGQCMPTKLTPTSNGTVDCNILVIYPGQTDQSAGCTDSGMCNPANPVTCGCAANDSACIVSYQSILKRYQDEFRASLGDGGASQPTPVVCVYKQLVSGTDYPGATCEGSTNAGWCYVQGAENTGGCPQAIKFGGSGPPAGTTLSLECSQ